MAFAGLAPYLRADAAPSSLEGAGSVMFPTVDASRVVGGIVQQVVLEECLGCSRCFRHKPTTALKYQSNHGLSRYEPLDESTLLTPVAINALGAAYHVAGWAFLGFVPSSSPYNVGATANNATQEVGYRILSAAGDRIVVEGDARRVAFSASVLNPNWPASGGRLTTVPFAQSIPIGAEVVFQPPSALSAKRVALVRGVESQDGTTSTLTLTCDVSAARQPIDEADPPADGYWCLVRWPALATPKYLRLDTQRDEQWIRRVARFSGPGPHRIPGGRIIPPRAFTGAFELVVDGITIADDEADARLSYRDTGTGWEAWLDLADFSELGARVSYWTPAPFTAPANLRAHYLGTCANDRRDRWAGGVARYCSEADASLRDEYRSPCWKPDCSHFVPAEGDATDWQTQSYELDDTGDGTFWSGLFSRADWVLAQRVAGLNQYQLEYPSGAGASLEALVGGFYDTVPVGKMPTRTPYASAPLGKRLAWSDSGSTYHAVVGGAFYLKAYDYTSTGGPSYSWDASGDPTAGAIAEVAENWQVRGDASGAALAGGLEMLPPYLGRTVVYSYDHESVALGRSLAGNASARLVVAGATVSATDATTAAYAEAAFLG